MPDLQLHKPLYWDWFTDGSGGWRRSGERPPGEDLAAMRRGAGRDPGSVPSMWQLHATEVEDEWLARHRDTWSAPRAFEAEHHALTLFGFHQQSLYEPMHVKGVGLGGAMLALRQSGRASEEGIDRRFAAAATAATVKELAQHLRRLVTLLRGPRRPLDYTRLLHDLIRWQEPAYQGRVRRRWGLEYYASRRQEHDTEQLKS